VRSISWAGFCYPDVKMRPLVHFFPSAGSVGAPYPIACKLTVFGQAGEGEKSMVIEGARLSQPDGVSLVDAFEDFGLTGSASGSSAVVGLEIELSLLQPGVNIEKSVTIVEFSGSEGVGVRFRPQKMQQSEQSALPQDMAESRRALLLRDSFLKTSLVLVNPGAQDMQFLGKVLPGGASLTETVPARSVKEIHLPDTIFDSAGPISCSFGLTRGALLDNRKSGQGELLTYALYRDAPTNEVISVSVL